MPHQSIQNKPLPIPSERLIEFASQSTWYHTLELSPGIKTAGVYDHSSFLNCYGFPDDLADVTVLDVGTSNGYFAFEFERRKAAKVLAVDMNFFDGSVRTDVSSPHLDKYLRKYRSLHEINLQFSDIYDSLDIPCGHQLLAAKILMGSQIQYQDLSIYKLPILDSQFDLVFCGDLVEHLKNPLLALENLVKVTKKKCIVSLSSAIPNPCNDSFDALKLKVMNGIASLLGMPQIDPAKDLCYFGNGAGGSFFHFYPETFRQALLASGFDRVEIYSSFDLPNVKSGAKNHHVIYHCYPPKLNQI